jgi:hypothetical protein
MAFQNIHLVDLQYNGASALTLPTSGPMARPALGTYYYDLSNASYGISSTSFGWPLGTVISINGSPKPQYKFSKVIEFDPQGSARFICTNNTSSYPDAIPLYLEIGLQPSYGGTAAGPQGSQIAAIQISGLSGAVHIYRP